MSSGPASDCPHPSSCPRAVTYPGQCLSVLRTDHPFIAHIRLSSPGGSLWGRKPPPQPAPLLPGLAPLPAGAATACPLLVACGTAGGMIGLEPGFPPCSEAELPNSQPGDPTATWGRWETLLWRGVVTSLRGVIVVGTWVLALHL